MKRLLFSLGLFTGCICGCAITNGNQGGNNPWAAWGNSFNFEPTPIPNPHNGNARVTRNMTPLGYKCEPDKSWVFELYAKDGEICLHMEASDVLPLDMSLSPKPINAQMRVDGQTSDTFELRPSGPPSPHSMCSSTMDGGRQWVTYFEGCLPSGTISPQSETAELLFPDTSGDETFVSWIFDKETAQPESEGDPNPPQ